MSWIPVFRVGLWNAWMLALFMVLHPYIMTAIDTLVGTGDINHKMGDVPGAARRKGLDHLPMLLLILLFLYSIVLPLRLGTVWLYVGLSVYLLGIAIFFSALITAVKTPSGQVFKTGVYRYSRHPLYLSFLLIFLGISLSCASYLFLVLSMGWMFFPLSQVNLEEQGCKRAFGNLYQEYMNTTPKWFGLPKSG